MKKREERCKLSIRRAQVNGRRHTLCSLHSRSDYSFAITANVTLFQLTESVVNISYHQPPSSPTRNPFIPFFSLSLSLSHQKRKGLKLKVSGMCVNPLISMFKPIHIERLGFPAKLSYFECSTSTELIDATATLFKWFRFISKCCLFSQYTLAATAIDILKKKKKKMEANSLPLSLYIKILQAFM